jgi:hypothetical protein
MLCLKQWGTGNNWGDWDHFIIIQKIREIHTRKT